MAWVVWPEKSLRTVNCSRVAGGSEHAAQPMDERASEGEDADLDDAEDFAAEESEVDDEATLEEEEVISANNDAWPVHSEI